MMAASPASTGQPPVGAHQSTAGVRITVGSLGDHDVHGAGQVLYEPGAMSISIEGLAHTPG